VVAAKPTSLRVRMYNVGFGDCFLVSFFYAGQVGDAESAGEKRDARHILFDCGSTSRPHSKRKLKSIVGLLEKDCDGRLDAVVISHRHRDHLSGFGAKETAEVLKRLEPRLVVRSWTEHPDLAKQAKGPAPGATGVAGRTRLPADVPADRAAIAYITALARGQLLAEQVVDRSTELKVGGSSDLVTVAKDQMPNDEAVTLLEELGKDGKAEYLSAERRTTRLSGIVPGVKFSVVGPPTPAQWPKVAKQAESSDQFWAGAGEVAGRLFAEPSSDAPRPPLGTARWIVDKLRDGDQQNVTGLVRWLDDAMNNTSVMLLLEVGGHTLLFGGDAQVESWGWVLNQKDDPGLVQKLRDVDLYKVGHHGSRNASPRPLVELWQKRPQAPFLSMLSTKEGVHGSGEHIVPRKPLVDALKDLGPVLSTDDGDADWIQVTAKLPAGQYLVEFAPD
jgi:beta-lactamase superfamily II metal-dependent hydrolase